jgi:dTDP-4-amino-4,6-dideoxygalactose transaminase
MRIGRTLAPAAAPIGWGALLGAAAGILFDDDLAELDADFARAFGVDRVWLVSSGTAALAVTLAALKRDRRETDVVIPAYTCFSVPAAVMHAGLRPVPCDVDRRTFDFDPAALGEAIGPNTLCVVAHDLFGIPADIARIRAICRGRDIAIVEDAAQGAGVRWQGQLLGTRGDVGIVSFGRGKHVTCGAGGLIVTASPQAGEAIDAICGGLPPVARGQMARAWAAAMLMSVFVRPSLFWIPAAMPWLRLGETIFPTHIDIGRLSRVHRALLEDWRQRLTESNGVRAELAAEFAERLSLDLPCGAAHPYLRLPVLAPSAAERARWLATSRGRGLGLAAAYPSPVADIPQLAALVGRRPFVHAAHVAEHLVTVPTHPWVTTRDVDAIVDCLRPAPSARWTTTHEERWSEGIDAH